MAIVHPKAPADGQALLERELAKIMKQASAPAAFTLGSAAPGQLTVSEPHRCYMVGLDEVAGGRLLEAAVPTAWRYLIFAGDRAVADAELVEIGSNALEFASLHYGPIAAATIGALNIAEGGAAVGSADFELRCLHVPALRFVAIWLHGAREEILIPIDPTSPALAAHQPQAEASLRAKLTQAAIEKKRQFDQEGGASFGG